MSITADPLFVAAEVAWRRESLTAGLPRTDRRRDRHTRRATSAAVRLSHRHAARPA
jgi:hypothetical protein